MISRRRRRNAAKILAWSLIDDAVQHGAVQDEPMEAELKALTVEMLNSMSEAGYERAEADLRAWRADGWS